VLWRSLFDVGVWSRFGRNPRESLLWLLTPILDVSYQRRNSATIARSHDVVLSNLSALQSGRVKIVDLSELHTLEPFSRYRNTDAADRLGAAFAGHNSDKARHDYHLIYQPILAMVAESNPLPCLFEIGIGSNNLRVSNNMGVLGTPGASLRAFRDWLPTGRLIGGDVDASVLFNEERISTHFLDQLRPESLRAVLQKNSPIDLLIDDGLHTAEANSNTVISWLSVVQPSGWLVVEDISPGRSSEDLWKLLGQLLPAGYQSWLVKTSVGYCFLSRRD